jgi:dihydroorotate dehydrogenase
MIEGLIKVRNLMIKGLYRAIVRPILFRIDPEKIHDIFIKVGKTLGKVTILKAITAFFFQYRNEKLHQELVGIKFENPIGLAAGFDKNAEMTDLIRSVGFGHIEVGSITGEPCKGNEKPRLWRLKKSKGLVVWYGLKNDGCKRIAKRLEGKKFNLPIGISIAKTNSEATITKEEGIKDYLKAYRNLKDIGDYITINISCPNAYGGQPFTNAKDLDQLLMRINEIRNKKPIFIKMPPDLSHKDLDEVLDTIKYHRIDGIICANLTKDRKNKKISEKVKDTGIPEVGGVSGQPVRELSTEMIKYIYKKTNGKYVIVGCGGVFTAKDAYEKIRAGASLIQLITGMIYQGPQAIGEINQGLLRLLEKDGFKRISQAIGIDANK